MYTIHWVGPENVRVVFIRFLEIYMFAFSVGSCLVPLSSCIRHALRTPCEGWDLTKTHNCWTAGQGCTSGVVTQIRQPSSASRSIFRRLPPTRSGKVSTGIPGPRTCAQAEASPESGVRDPRVEPLPVCCTPQKGAPRKQSGFYRPCQPNPG
jgi:hypothetical protein